MSTLKPIYAAAYIGSSGCAVGSTQSAAVHFALCCLVKSMMCLGDTSEKYANNDGNVSQVCLA